jgi:FixJ family two-component response regulator
LTKADINIPIIFLTAYSDIPTSVRAIKAGALEFLTNPFADEDLLEAIQQGISRDRGAWRERHDIKQQEFETSSAQAAA